MSASASPEAAFGAAPTGSPKVIRSIGSCAGWLILSFGLWGFAWIYNTLTEIGTAMRKDTNATLKTVLFLVPIVNPSSCTSCGRTSTSSSRAPVSRASA